MNGLDTQGLRFVSYYRTSTDDKGQDPLRQKAPCDTYARAGRHEVVGEVIDEGTSGAKDPFQRQHFLEAIELAKEKGAHGILVEAIDRATRGGIEAWMVLKAVLRMDHGLVVKAANTPAGLPPAIEEFYESAIAMVARLFRDRLREQIKTGIARAKSLGFPNGRPGRAPKPALTLAEKDLLRELVLQKGAGVDKVALEVSRVRGAFDLGDPKAMMKTRVGPTWLWRQVHNDPSLADVTAFWTARRLGVPASQKVRANANRPVKGGKARSHAPAATPAVAVVESAAAPLPTLEPTTARERQARAARGVRNEQALQAPLAASTLAKMPRRRRGVELEKEPGAGA